MYLCLLIARNVYHHHSMGTAFDNLLLTMRYLVIGNNNFRSNKIITPGLRCYLCRFA